MTGMEWIMQRQEELLLAAQLLEPVLLLLLTAGVYALARQLRRANRMREKLYAGKRPAADKPEAPQAGERVLGKTAAVQGNPQRRRADEEENRIITSVLQEIFP